MRKDLRKRLVGALWKKHNIIFFITAIVVYAIWSLIPIKEIRLVSIIIFLCAHFYYNLKSEDKSLIGYINWIMLAVIGLVSFAYFGLYINNSEVAMGSLIAIPYIVLLSIAMPLGAYLWKSRNTKSLFISYAIFAVFIILIFGYWYLIIGASGEGSIKWVYENSTVNDFYYATYYSTQVFYSNNFGDIIPLGSSRIIAVTETIVSAIIHILVIGTIINNIRTPRYKNRKNNLRFHSLNALKCAPNHTF